MNKSEAAIARWQKPEYRKKMAPYIARRSNFKFGKALRGEAYEGFIPFEELDI
jgi:hypothetical protein